MLAKNLFWKLLIPVILLNVALSAIGESRSGEAREVVIEIRDFEYVMAAPTEIAAGDTVIFINKDFVPHTATALDGSWDSGQLKKGESWRLSIEDGTALEYFCRYHPSMTGKLSGK